MWFKLIDRLPQLHVDDCYELASDDVLCLFKNGAQRVCHFSQWEDYDPKWRTCDSEGWDVTEHIVYWRELPALPEDFVKGIK